MTQFMKRGAKQRNCHQYQVVSMGRVLKAKDALKYLWSLLVIKPQNWIEKRRNPARSDHDFSGFRLLNNWCHFCCASKKESVSRLHIWFSALSLLSDWIDQIRKGLSKSRDDDNIHTCEREQPKNGSEHIVFCGGHTCSVQGENSKNAYRSHTPCGYQSGCVRLC